MMENDGALPHGRSGRIVRRVQASRMLRLAGSFATCVMDRETHYSADAARIGTLDGVDEDVRIFWLDRFDVRVIRTGSTNGTN